MKWFLHVPVTDRFAIPQNFIYSQFPLCRVASQLDVVTLSSNVFPSCTIQNNCGNFFNLGSRFAKAGRPLGPVYMELGVPMLVWWPRLGRVTRLSIQSLIWSPHLSCKLDQIKMRDYMDRGVTHQHVNRSLNCTMYIICILISDRPLLFWLLLCSHSIFFSS